MLPDGGRAVATCVLVALCLNVAATDSKECGENPMKQVLLVAKRMGRTLDNVLMVLRDIDAPAYEVLARRFRRYAACVGLVDTGYFRKRSSPGTVEVAPPAAFSPDVDTLVPQKRTPVSFLDVPLATDSNRYPGRPPLDVQKQLDGSASAGEQMLADAADMNRSLTSIFRKARQIMELERLAGRRKPVGVGDGEIPVSLDDLGISLRPVYQ